MKTALKFLIVTMIMNLTMVAQNLVPNFSFEQHDSCPNMQDQIHYALGWKKCSDSLSTPDYYNACSSTYGIPYSSFIHQDDHRNCSAYIGLITFSSPS